MVRDRGYGAHAVHRTAIGAGKSPRTVRLAADCSAQCRANRDNAGYGADARMTASSVTAFVLLIPKRGLAITGK